MNETSEQSEAILEKATSADPASELRTNSAKTRLSYKIIYDSR